MKVFNLYNDELDNSNEREGWTFRAAKVGEHIGGELIGAGLYEAEPGNKVWPYHTHHANEEWLLVVRGRPTLRTPEGERQLDEVTSSASPGARRERIRSGTEATPRSVCSCSRHSSPRRSSSTSIRGRWAHAAWRGNGSCSAVLVPSSTTGKARSSWKRGCRRRVRRNDSDSRRRDGISRRHRAGVALPQSAPEPRLEPSARALSTTTRPTAARASRPARREGAAEVAGHLA